jgi:hypothetical protein
MSAERNPRQVAQEMAEFDRLNQLLAERQPWHGLGAEYPPDPTGVDCWEAHESAEDQA